MKMNLNILWCAVALATTWCACRNTKPIQKIQTAISKKDTTELVIVNRELPATPSVDSSALINEIYQKIRAGYIDFVTFSAKLKIEYTDQSGKSQGANAQIRIQKDSLMWVSLTGALGVEGFRALITPDSVILMDKLEKTISRRSIASLQELTNLPLDFSALQDIIIGNPVYFTENIVSYKTDGFQATATSIGPYFKHLIDMDITSGKINYSKLDDVEASRNRTCFIAFSDYIIQQNKYFSTKREITVAEKSKLSVKIEYKQIAFGETLSFPFNIPKSYKVK
jgi:hypothetical protein